MMGLPKFSKLLLVVYPTLLPLSFFLSFFLSSLLLLAVPVHHTHPFQIPANVYFLSISVLRMNGGGVR